MEFPIKNIDTKLSIILVNYSTTLVRFNILNFGGLNDNIH